MHVDESAIDHMENEIIDNGIVAIADDYFLSLCLALKRDMHGGEQQTKQNKWKKKCGTVIIGLAFANT